MTSETGFSDSEKAAMQQRAAELRETKGLKGAAKLAREFEACLSTIEELEGTDNLVASRLHIIVSEEAPHLTPKTWYGFPSYAKDGKVVVFYQPASKFETRYGTIGFSEDANLDDGIIWPTSYAVLDITPEVEKTLRELVRRAAGAPDTV